RTTCSSSCARRAGRSAAGERPRVDRASHARSSGGVRRWWSRALPGGSRRRRGARVSLEVVIVAGDAYARGRAAGARLAPKIERSLAFYRGLHGHSPSELAALVAPYREAAERSLPELVSWLEGLAAGARVPFEEVLAVNAFEELEPHLSPATVGTARCTTVVARGHGRTLLGHNEQWFAG